MNFNPDDNTNCIRLNKINPDEEPLEQQYKPRIILPKAFEEKQKEAKKLFSGRFCIVELSKLTQNEISIIGDRKRN